MKKKTKIIATLGPGSERLIKELIVEGVDIFRLNLKHNTVEWHEDKIKKIRALSDKVGIMADIPKIEMAKKIKGVDFFALSYLKSKTDVEKLRKIAGDAKIIAKIENKKALENLEEIISVSDGIMVARGDLGEAVPVRELAYWQKKIIDMCRTKGTAVIVATQMLRSMVDSVKPTRAEATDVANAIFDGTDAVMLSEETAIGKYPVEAVKQMAGILTFCEDKEEYKTRLMKLSKTATEVLVEQAINISNSFKIQAFLVFTKSGKTARIISSYRKNLPIVAVSNDKIACNTLNLSYGVIPYHKDLKAGRFDIESPIFAELIKKGILNKDGTIVVIHGNNWLSSGSTSNISILKL